MAPKRAATKSLAGESAKRLKSHDLKKKPSDLVVEEIFASDERVAEVDGDDMEKKRGTCLTS